VVHEGEGGTVTAKNQTEPLGLGCGQQVGGLLYQVDGTWVRVREVQLRGVGWLLGWNAGGAGFAHLVTLSPSPFPIYFYLQTSL